MGRDSRFRSEMDAHAAEIKRTYGGWDKLIGRKDKDFEAARDRTVGTFNEYVDKSRALLIRNSLFEFLTALGRAADNLRSNFRNIESSAGRLAIELEEKARRFEYDGGVDAQSNDYALDVEVLQHPNGRKRFWSWYYDDQVATTSESSDQTEVLAAVRSALKPKFDEQGRPVRRTAREIIGDIEDSLTAAAEGFLSKRILGDPKSDDPFEKQGLRLDDALALEAKYYGLYTENPHASPREALGNLAPLAASKLWLDENIERYARRKLETALAKAQPLSRFHPETKSMINHADMLLVGVHSQLMAGPLKKAFDEATYGKNAAPIEDWPDADRMVLYHSILGVTPYCFPHINEEMKSAYRRFQNRDKKAWPLHIDHHWEELPDLDPNDRRRDKEARDERTQVGVLALALGFARSTIAREGTDFVLKLDNGASVKLASSAADAAYALLHLEENKPAVYDAMVAPLVTDARGVSESKALAAEAKEASEAWKKRAMELELLDSRDGAEEAEYQGLREVNKITSRFLS